jgi:PAS domain S-box-containing protein
MMSHLFATDQSGQAERLPSGRNSDHDAGPMPAEPSRIPPVGPPLGWRVLAPTAAVGLVILLLALLGSHHFLLRWARAADLDRAAAYLDLGASYFQADAGQRTPEEILMRLRAVGALPFELLPPGTKPPSGYPRYLTATSSVEAWTTLRDPAGEPSAILRLKMPAEFSRLVLRLLRFATAAFALALLLLLATTWLSFERQVTRPLLRLAGRWQSLFAGSPDDAPTPRDPVDSLAAAAAEAVARWQVTSAAHLRLLDRHGEMACAGTLDGTLTEVNAAYCRYFGKTREELVGSNYADLIPSADRAEALESLRKLSARNPENTVEHRVLLPDGSIRWTRWRDTAIAGPDGTIVEVLSFGTDISAERRLAEELELFRGGFDQMQSLALTGGLTWDLSRDHMEWTDETCRLLGLDQTAVQPSLDRLLECVAAEDRLALRKFFERARDSGGSFEHEFDVLLPDGSRRVLQSRAEVRADPQTKLLTQLTCTVRDITALRDAEAATRRELRFREAVEQSLASGIVAVDDDGRILSVNPAFCAMTGWSEQELLGLSAPYPYWPEEEIHAIRRAFDTTIGGCTPTEGYQLRFCRKDGPRFDVLVKVAPLLDDRDQRLGWLGAVTDITSIQQVRRELTVTNERLQLAQDVVEFGIWDWDPQRDQLFWDRHSFALFGEPQATDPGAVWARVLPAPERERLTYELQRLIAAGGSSGQDLIRVRWPDGSPHVISSTYLILRDDRGQAVRVFGVNRDLTRELEAENELRYANERLAAALEGGKFGTFEHVIGQGDYNYNLANYEINGIDPSITDPAELFAAWQKVTGEFFPQLIAEMSALPATQTNYAYEFTARPADQEPRRVRVSLFIERNQQGHPVRLVGITRRLE